MKEETYKKAKKFLLDYHWTDESLRKAENPMTLVATMIQVFVDNYNLQPQEQESNKGTDLPPVDKQEKLMQEKQTADNRYYDAMKFLADWNEITVSDIDAAIINYIQGKYASQSQSVLPSEEEIMIYFNNHTSGYLESFATLTNAQSPKIPVMSRSAVLEFAKWMKSQLKQGYPKEFVEWIGLEGVEMRYNDEIPCWIVYKYNSIEANKIFDTLDELFTYWKEQIKKQ